MNEGKTLVVFFSRTGTTAKLAQSIHRALGGELIEIRARRYPRTSRGYFHALLDAALGRAVPISSKALRETQYDLVLVGTPIWGSALSAPVRTYLAHSLPTAKRVAFFATYGGSGAPRVFRQMREACGRRPAATLDVTTAEVLGDKYALKLQAFVRSVAKPAAAAA